MVLAWLLLVSLLVSAVLGAMATAAAVFALVSSGGGPEFDLGDDNGV
jgi:hypothetical protein